MKKLFGLASMMLALATPVAISQTAYPDVRYNSVRIGPGTTPGSGADLATSLASAQSAAAAAQAMATSAAATASAAQAAANTASAAAAAAQTAASAAATPASVATAQAAATSAASVAASAQTTANNAATAAAAAQTTANNAAAAAATAQAAANAAATPASVTAAQNAANGASAAAAAAQTTANSAVTSAAAAQSTANSAAATASTAQTTASSAASSASAAQTAATSAAASAAGALNASTGIPATATALPGLTQRFVSPQAIVDATVSDNLRSVHGAAFNWTALVSGAIGTNPSPTDDSAALAEAVSNFHTTFINGRQSPVLFPAGVSYIATMPGNFTKGDPGDMIGLGAAISQVQLGTSACGDFYSVDNNAIGNWVNTPTGKPTPNTNFGGPTIKDLTIMGDMSASCQQNALNFKGVAKQVVVSNVTVENMHGQTLLTGVKTSGEPFAQMTESYIDHLRMLNSGIPGLYDVVIDTNGTGDGDNQIKMRHIRDFNSNGGCFLEENHTTNSGNRQISLSSYSCENNNTGSLYQFGTQDSLQAAGGVDGWDITAVNPCIGCPAVYLESAPGSTFANTTRNVDLDMPTIAATSRPAPMIRWGRSGGNSFHIGTGSQVGPGTFTGYITSASASFTGSIATASTGAIPTLTVSAVASGTLYPHAPITCTSCANYTEIVNQLSGTAGGVGTYSITVPQNVASRSMSATYGLLNVTALGTATGVVPFEIITGAGVSTPPPRVVPDATQVSGTQFGVGVYVLDIAQTVGSSGSPVTLTETMPSFVYEYGAAGPNVVNSDSQESQLVNSQNPIWAHPSVPSSAQLWPMYATGFTPPIPGQIPLSGDATITPSAIGSHGILHVQRYGANQAAVSYETVDASGNLLGTPYVEGMALNGDWNMVTATQQAVYSRFTVTAISGNNVTITISGSNVVPLNIPLSGQGVTAYPPITFTSQTSGTAGASGVYVTSAPITTNIGTTIGTALYAIDIPQGTGAPVLYNPTLVQDPPANDSSSKIPDTAWVRGVVPTTFDNYLGPWNANTNAPNLQSGVCTNCVVGSYRTVGAAGTTLLDGVSTWLVDDRVYWGGTTWSRRPGVNSLPIVAAGSGLALSGPANAPVVSHAVPSGAAAQAYCDATHFPQITTDAFGHVTSVTCTALPTGSSTPAYSTLVTTGSCTITPAPANGAADWSPGINSQTCIWSTLNDGTHAPRTHLAFTINYTPIYTSSAWAAGQAETTGQRRVSGTSVYSAQAACTTPASGGTAPSGTGTGISDGSGGCLWNYVSPGVAGNMQFSYSTTAPKAANNGLVDPIELTGPWTGGEAWGASFTQMNFETNPNANFLNLQMFKSGQPVSSMNVTALSSGIVYVMSGAGDYTSQ